MKNTTRTRITERTSYPNNKGIARFFVDGLSDYGYWVPETFWDEIVPKNIAKQMREDDQRTIECQLSLSAINLISKNGLNPFAQKAQEPPKPQEPQHSNQGTGKGVCFDCGRTGYRDGDSITDGHSGETTFWKCGWCGNSWEHVNISEWND